MKHLKNVLITVLVSLLLVQARKEVKLPEYFRFCKRDSQINNCLKTVIQDLIPKLTDGLPEVGMSSIDPLTLDELAVDYVDRQVYVKELFRNLRTFGLGQVSIKNVRSQITNETFKMEIDYTTPQLLVESNFIGDIRINAVVFRTKGYVNATFVDIVDTLKLNGEMKKIKNQDHIRIKEVHMRPVIQDLKIFITDIVAGNPEISGLARAALNQNWKEVYKQLLPIAANYWNASLVQQTNKLFLKVPHNVLFPLE